MGRGAFLSYSSKPPFPRHGFLSALPVHVQLLCLPCRDVPSSGTGRAQQGTHPAFSEAPRESWPGKKHPNQVGRGSNLLPLHLCWHGCLLAHPGKEPSCFASGMSPSGHPAPSETGQMQHLRAPSAPSLWSLTPGTGEAMSGWGEQCREVMAGGVSDGRESNGSGGKHWGK